METAPPRYLAAYADLYAENPRHAALTWFREATCGLFLHYGLYALLEGRWNGKRVDNKGAEWIRWAAPHPL